MDIARRYHGQGRLGNTATVSVTEDELTKNTDAAGPGLRGTGTAAQANNAVASDDFCGTAEPTYIAFCPSQQNGLLGMENIMTTKIPSLWERWCTTGRHGKGARKKNAVLKCLKRGHVRGHFSDIPLRPNVGPTHSMYPSLEHLVDPKNHAEMVVEARIINDMKSHLTEEEFWKVIDHLFLVGIQKGKIKAPFGKRLPKGWSPAKHYTKKEAKPTPGGDSSTHADAGLGTPQE